MLYMAEQRELLRHNESPPGFAELTRIVANKWAALDASDKKKYLDASELEKERRVQSFEIMLLLIFKICINSVCKRGHRTVFTMLNQFALH